MELMTDGLREKFKEIGCQDGNKDPLVVVKYFNPCGSGTWWVTEYDENGILFGYATIGMGDECDEWGNISLKELEDLNLF